MNKNMQELSVIAVHNLLFTRQLLDLPLSRTSASTEVNNWNVELPGCCIIRAFYYLVFIIL